MAARACLFLLITLTGVPIATDRFVELIVWNVGQGQWVTIVDSEGCWHLDMGGEFAPWREIMRTCRARSNYISFSHWDADHISFAAGARNGLPETCVLNRPSGPASQKKVRALSALSDCQIPSPFSQWASEGGKTSNAKSWVVNWRGVLAPGDSSRHEEKLWIQRLKGLKEVKILILGHHGSRTSTSEALLRALPSLKLAIASARRPRYGHPHAEVVRELSRKRIPLLRTEEWGSIHIQL